MLSILGSVTTRPKRGRGHDREYSVVSPVVFHNMHERDEFEWVEHKVHHWYGTTRADIKGALSRDLPSVTHIVHDCVKKLQDAVLRDRGNQGVFSFLVVCDDERILRERIENRPGEMSEEEISKRLQDMHDLQEFWKKSGLYHAVIVNNGDKSKKALLGEMLDHLAMPIPAPRKF